MAVYRFIGSSATKEGVCSLDRFGQPLIVSDATAQELISEGIALLPEAEFAKRFTEDEARKYSTLDFQQAAPESFHEKRKQAWIWLAQQKQADASQEEVAHANG